MSADLLNAQAAGGIDGANAYLQAQQELARRKQEAVDAALAQAQGRGAASAGMDAIAAGVARPYDMADVNLTQQSADFTADMARRQSRWNEYAHNVESARGLVQDVAKSKSDLIDADTKRQLAILEAQRRSSGGGRSGGGGGGGGGGGSSSKKQLSKAELQSYLGDRGVNALVRRAQLTEMDRKEVQQKTNRSSAMAGLGMALPAFDQREMDRRVDVNASRYNPGVGPVSNKMPLKQSQVLLGYQTERQSQVPDYGPKLLARKALEKQLAAARQQATSSAETASNDLYRPQALIDEMLRIATTDPEIAGRFTPYDLAEVLSPKVNVGESASDYLNRINGFDPAAQQRALDQQTKQQSEAEQATFDAALAEVSQTLGVDVSALATAAKVPVQTMVELLQGDSEQAQNLQGAIARYNELASTASDPDALDKEVFAIEQQLDPIQRRVFRIYLGL